MKKRADGRYCKQVLIGYYSDGRRKMKSIYGKTIKEVERKERELQNQINIGIIPDKKITLEKWTNDWLNIYKKNISFNTSEMYKSVIKKYIIPKLGDILVSKIKTIQIQSLLNEIIQNGNIRTAEVCKLTLKQIIKQAQIEGLISTDVMTGIQPIKSQNKEKPVLSSEELAAIEQAELTDMQRVFLNIMLYAGLRRGEALALTMPDIDLSRRVISVNKSLLFKKNVSEIKEPKTAAGHREIPIPERLVLDLYRYIKRLNNFKLFPMKNGEYMTKSSFRKFWGTIIKRIQEADSTLAIDFTPHTFRHTYATNLYYAGVDVKTAQYFLGHSSLSVTLEIYTHLDKKNMMTEVNKLNEYLNQSKISQKSFCNYSFVK